MWLSVAWVVACGGRSVGDPIFDEPPGGAAPDPVGGWSNSSSGGSASGGRTKTTGGRASTGGTPAVTGGRPSNTGGTTTVDRAAKSCASFCQSLVKVCGSAIDSNEAECASGCVLGPFCGDKIVQAEFGESCDVGPGGDGVCRGCRQLDIY